MMAAHELEDPDTLTGCSAVAVTVAGQGAAAQPPALTAGKASAVISSVFVLPGPLSLALDPLDPWPEGGSGVKVASSRRSEAEGLRAYRTDQRTGT